VWQVLPSVGDKKKQNFAFVGSCTLSEYFPSSVVVVLETFVASQKSFNFSNDTDVLCIYRYWWSVGSILLLFMWCRKFYLFLLFASARQHPLATCYHNQNVTQYIIRSILRQSRPNKAGLKCPSVRPSTESFFDFNEIWHVGRGRWVMHDGMQYDPVQGKVKVTSPWKLEIRPFSKTISSAIYNWSWQLNTGS